MSSASLDRLGRVCRLLQLITAGLGVAILALFATYWFDPVSLPGRLTQSYLLGSGPDQLDLVAVGAAWLHSVVTLLVLEGCVLTAFRLFGAWGTGDVLTPGNGGLVRLIGVLVSGLPALKLLGGGLVSVALSWSRSPGNRELTLSLGVDDALVMLLGLLILALGWVLGEAAAIADENRQFV